LVLRHSLYDLIPLSSEADQRTLIGTVDPTLPFANFWIGAVTVGGVVSVAIKAGTASKSGEDVSASAPRSVSGSTCCVAAHSETSESTNPTKNATFLAFMSAPP
jgi:hypothetical protein